MRRVEHSPEATLKATQLIALSLMAGIVSTIGIVVFLINNGVVGQMATGNTVSLIMAGLTIMNFGILGAIANWGVSAGSTLPLHEIWQRRMVLRFALLEGTALLNAVACIIERHWWSFVIMLGVLLLMGLLFPTQERFKHFIEIHTPAT